MASPMRIFSVKRFSTSYRKKVTIPSNYRGCHIFPSNPQKVTSTATKYLLHTLFSSLYTHFLLIQIGARSTGAISSQPPLPLLCPLHWSHEETVCESINGSHNIGWSVWGGIMLAWVDTLSCEPKRPSEAAYPLHIAVHRVCSLCGLSIVIAITITTDHTHTHS